MNKNDEYVKIQSVSVSHIKGHRYKFGIVFPSLPTKMIDKSELSGQSWAYERDRFNEIIENFIDREIIERHDIECGDVVSWESKEIPYTANDYYKKYMDVFQVESREPVRFVYYFYTDTPIKRKDFERYFLDEIIAFGADYLATLVSLEKIKEFPGEIQRKTIAKIPIEKIIKEMEKDNIKKNS